MRDTSGDSRLADQNMTLGVMLLRLAGAERLSPPAHVGTPPPIGYTHGRIMLTIKAKVRNGRLVVDEPTDLPEGEEVELIAVLDHGEDELDENQRAALHDALAKAKEDIEAGRLVDGDRVLEGLLDRRG